MLDPSTLNVTPTGGRFRPGESGNPGGRPKGRRNKKTRLAEALLEGEADALTRVAIERALAGDINALRLCLERLVPVPRSRRVRIGLPPDMVAADEVTAALATTLKAMAAGRIAPDEAATVAQVLDAQRRAIETQELERRLVRLEQGLGDDPRPGAASVPAGAASWGTK